MGQPPTFCSITDGEDCRSNEPLRRRATGSGKARLRHSVHGPLDFTLKGILSKIAVALAGAGVSIFAISTYDTDYVLVPSADADKARSALTASGTCRFTDP